MEEAHIIVSLQNKMSTKGFGAELSVIISQLLSHMQRARNIKAELFGMNEVCC